MINWADFPLVAVVALVATVVVVGLYSLGIKLLSVPSRPEGADAGAAAASRDDELDDVAGQGRPRLATAGAGLCFALCGAAVLYGIYLIVPALHGT